VTVDARTVADRDRAPSHLAERGSRDLLAGVFWGVPVSIPCQRVRAGRLDLARARSVWLAEAVLADSGTR